MFSEVPINSNSPHYKAGKQVLYARKISFRFSLGLSNLLSSEFHDVIDIGQIRTCLR